MKDRIWATIAALLGTSSASATTWNEAIDGDLSNDRLVPTLIVVTPGSNLVTMSSQTGDRDYFRFAVPVGMQLTSIFHASYSSADDLSFFALQRGTQITESPTGANPANLLGYMHFGAATNGTEIIDNLATSNLSTPAAMGFFAPLGEGDYAFWVQQTGTASTYSFDFVVSPVPLPAAGWLLLSGVAGVAALTRRRRAAGAGAQPPPS